MKNFKKIISLSISNEVYLLLKEKGNMSSYVNDLVLKESYKTANREKIINEFISERNNYHRIEI